MKLDADKGASPGKGQLMQRVSVIRFRLWWERAFWVLPACGVIAGLVLHEWVAEADELIVASMAKVPVLFSTSSATQLLAAIGGGMITFTGFVFSFVVLLLQFGSSQYSPRTVSYFLRARSTQVILGCFLATISFTFMALLDVGSLGRADFAPGLTVAVAVLLLFTCLGAFIALLHSVGSRVRVDAVLTAMGRRSRRQLVRRLALPRGAQLIEGESAVAESAGVVVRATVAGQTVAIDERRLVRTAKRHRLQLRLLVQIGDAITVGSALIRVVSPTGQITKAAGRMLASAVVVDRERSLHHDPFYSLRLLVDIGIRALSPGINDPTTAVRALDEIEGVLRVAADQPLGSRRITVTAATVVTRTPDWAAVVNLGLLEIMLSGSGQPQVTRRLVALLDALLADLPPAQADPLLELRDELTECVVAEGRNSALTAVALRPDRQGLGGTVRDRVEHDGSGHDGGGRDGIRAG